MSPLFNIINYTFIILNKFVIIFWHEEKTEIKSTWLHNSPLLLLNRFGTRIGTKPVAYKFEP